MWGALGAAPPSLLCSNELLGCYSVKHRSYHTLQHLDECFAWLPEQATASSAKTTNRRAQSGRSLRRCAQGLAAASPNVPVGTGAKIVVDIDFAILRAAAKRLDEYERTADGRRKESSLPSGLLSSSPVRR